MKSIIRSAAFLIMGTLIFTACTEDKTGKSPALVADKLEVETDDSDKIVPIIEKDSISEKEVKAIPPPPPPEPIRVDPRPRPWPDPRPPYDPIDPPYPIVEPRPEPIFKPVPPPQEDRVLDYVDNEAEFPGGSLAMRDFIAKNVKYPEIDKQQGNSGRVYVQFIVEKDGSLNSIEVIRSVSPTLDQEAVRVMKLMPKWTPGKVNGKPVRCKSRLPIQFLMH